MEFIWLFLTAVAFGKALALDLMLQDSQISGFSDQYRSQNTLGEYSFGYNEDHQGGGSFRREISDRHGLKMGSYGFRVADGRVRVVNYVADRSGFRADVVSNEPGLQSQTSPNGHLKVTKKSFNQVLVPGLRYSSTAPHVAFKDASDGGSFGGRQSGGLVRNFEGAASESLGGEQSGRLVRDFDRAASESLGGGPSGGLVWNFERVASESIQGGQSGGLVRNFEGAASESLGGGQTGGLVHNFEGVASESLGGGQSGRLVRDFEGAARESLGRGQSGGLVHDFERIASESLGGGQNGGLIHNFEGVASESLGEGQSGGLVRNLEGPMSESLGGGPSGGLVHDFERVASESLGGGQNGGLAHNLEANSDHLPTEREDDIPQYRRYSHGDITLQEESRLGKIVVQTHFDDHRSKSPYPDVHTIENGEKVSRFQRGKTFRGPGSDRSSFMNIEGRSSGTGFSPTRPVAASNQHASPLSVNSNEAPQTHSVELDKSEGVRYGRKLAALADETLINAESRLGGKPIAFYPDDDQPLEDDVEYDDYLDAFQSESQHQANHTIRVT